MRTNLFTFLSVVLTAISNSSIFAGNITYDIIPRTLFEGDGVGVAYDVTGFITTNGTLGNLSVDDIVDYSIDIAGANPYTFTPSSPDDGVTILGSVTATEDSIFLLEDLNNEDPNNDVLNFGTPPYADGTGSTCGTSRLHGLGPCIAWSNDFDPWFSDHLDSAIDYMSMGSTDRFWRRETIEVISFTLFPFPTPNTPTVPHTIGTVPEPSGMLLLIAAVATVSLRLRSKVR